MSVWAPTEFGWGVCYWMTIEGIPVVWIERGTALTLPDGFTTQDASLVIDHSSEVGQLIDREKGIGAGFPLTVQLLDTAAIRTWVRRASASSALTKDFLATDTTLHLTNLTGWPGSGAAWVGLERIEYSGTATSGGDPRLTGCTRGTAGTHARTVALGSMGAVASNLPRWWRGRQVRLYATPLTPSGAMTGATLADEADEIWRGTIDQGLERQGGIWQITAQALDRKLAVKLADAVTGRVVDTVARYPVTAAETLAVHVTCWKPDTTKLWEFMVQIAPYDGIPDGTLMTPAEQQAKIQKAWGDAVPLAPDLTGNGHSCSAILGDWTVYQTDAGKPYQEGFSEFVYKAAWVWLLGFKTSSVPPYNLVTIGLAFGAANLTKPICNVPCLPVGPCSISIFCSNGQHMVGVANDDQQILVAHSGLAVALDLPTSLLPQPGTLLVDGSPNIYYKFVMFDTNVAYFSYLYSDAQMTKPVIASVSPDATVRIGSTVPGKAMDVLLKMLESSGTGGAMGAMDLLAAGDGYALDAGVSGELSAVDAASFAAVAKGDLASLAVNVDVSGQSVEDVYTGLLALAQLGVMLRGDDGTGQRLQRIGLVSTEPGGSAWDVEIRDEHLLTTQQEPVASIKARDVPNTCTVTVPAGNAPSVVMVQDLSAMALQGKLSVDYTVPLSGILPVQMLTQWAWARLAAGQTEQVIELHLVPWLDFQPGDLVHLKLTHFAVWQWSTGTPGYTGVGRVLGNPRRLLDGAIVATILIDGQLTKEGLCPSATVTSFTGPAGAPTTITVEQRFYKHFSTTLAKQGTLRLRHYEAGLGNEAGGGGFAVTTVTDTGTDCQLSGLTASGGATLSSASWLTLPENATAGDYQKGFAHVDDGSIWG